MVAPARGPVVGQGEGGRAHRTTSCLPSVSKAVPSGTTECVCNKIWFPLQRLHKLALRPLTSVSSF